MKRYKFMGHYVGEPEPREVPEHIIRGFYDHYRIDRGALGAMSYAEFCETICDPHESIANSKGDFWAEKLECAHEWGYSGTAYGGDDSRWHGEGRCYCIYCGADGDG